MVKMSEEEKRWRAEDDARTLKAYAELKKDAARMKAAKKVLEKEKNDIISVLETASKKED